MIGIVDYGVGNLQSIINAIIFCNAKTRFKIISDARELKKVDKIILPGVGAFKNAIEKIKESSFDDAIYEEILKGKFLLGICLGMQLLASYSYEHGYYAGLNLIEGDIVNFRTEIKDLKIPHIGWNDVEFVRDDKIIQGIANYSDFYFVHSYFFKTKFKKNILGKTEYGIKFPSIVNQNNIYGVQFHPEKSQQVGLTLLTNFINL